LTPVRVLPYHDAQKAVWDDFVRRSRNGTFLFQRDYMDYHRDRFPDASRVLEHDGELVALFPATRKADVVSSHDGLTYGGLVADQGWKTPLAVASLHALCRAYADDGVKLLRYKTIPWFYHRAPTEEDRYGLFLAGAAVVRRDVTSVVDTRFVLPFQQRRERCVRKAARAGVVARLSDDLAAYWRLLSDTLQARHDRKPVHTLEEIARLQALFPQQIRLFAAYEGDHEGGEMRAGVLVYETDTTAHAQYIACDERGREIGALDLLFCELLARVFRDKPYFDFGISTVDDGRTLQRGLVDQKEGFGARTVAHDHYAFDPAAAADALERSGVLQ
jgi:hypothetical protein